MDFTFTQYAIAFLGAFLAGLIDAIAGGGGFISVPTLLYLDIPILQALGTVKFQAFFGTAMATTYFVRKKVINFKSIWYFPVVTFIFGALGTFLLSSFSNENIQIIIPILLIASAFYVLLGPKMQDIDIVSKLSHPKYIFSFGALVAFYDGFFGPGAGSFYILTLFIFLGYNSSKASAHAKILNLSSNLSATLLYSYLGYLILDLGIIMLIGSLIGNLIGARLVFLKGTKIVKPLLFIISFSIAIREITEFFSS